MTGLDLAAVPSRWCIRTISKLSRPTLPKFASKRLATPKLLHCGDRGRGTLKIKKSITIQPMLYNQVN